MESKIKNVTIYLLFDLLIFLFFLIGVYNYSQKADIPFKVSSTNINLIITEAKNNFSQNQIIQSIDGFNFKSREEIEVYLDSKSIGDFINVDIIENNSSKIFNVKLIPFYNSVYNIIAFIVGIIFFITGIIVLIQSKNKNVGIIFHWCMISIAAIVFMTWGNFTKLNLVLGILSRTGFHFGYALIPAFFLHFSFLFPFESKFNYRNILSIIYFISIFFAVGLSIIFSFYANSISINNIKLYINAYDLCSIFVVITVLFSIYIQYKNYYSTKLLEDRKKLRWILLGYFIGPLSYFLLWVIPQRLTSHGIIPEEIVLILVTSVPITFGIAIVKHRIMDVEIIIRRTIVYPIAISILVLIYFGIFTLIVNTQYFYSSNISSIAAAIFIALLFHPIKEFVKKFVNKKIFKVEYDYREAVNSFLNEIKEINEVEILIQKVISIINKLIPVRKVGYFAVGKDDKFILLTHNNLEEFIDKKINLNIESFLQNNFLPFSIPNSTEIAANESLKNLPIFNELDIKLLYPIKSTVNKLFGILVLGEKKSNAKFSIDDIDLLNTIVFEVSVSIERIKLQEELFLEKIENERLADLNEMKSFFVSSVSHDLKTPLTSIKMFAEILKSSKNITNEKFDQYLEIIEGESNRLTRLIDNVLNYSKIERGIKEYHFEKNNLNSIAEEVFKSTEYLLKIQNFTSEFIFHKVPLIINADKDSIIEAIINIISNSLKFSKENKSIKVTTTKKQNFAVIEIEDKGVGISEEDIENLFIPYFQSKQLKADELTGAGLGLTIVKNIIDAHQGKIEVVSTIGEGSTFKLLFPFMEDLYESNINY